MAEAEQVDAPSDTSPQITSNSESKDTPLPQRDSSSRLDDHQPPPSADTSQQVPERVSSEILVTEDLDDEVEFVFSVPRRRKKKRRRLGFPSQNAPIDPISPIPSAEAAVLHPLPDISMADMVPLLAPAPAPAPATEPGNMDIDVARDRSFNALNPPTTFESFPKPLNLFQSELSGSSPSHISQTIPFKIPPPWYAKSMPPPSSPTSPYYYAKSTMFTLPEQDYARKRKREEDSTEHSNCVSPYKVSSAPAYQSRQKALPSHSEFGSIGDHMGFVDFLEDPNVPITFEGVPPPLPPHRPIIPGWQDFSWKPSDCQPLRCPPSVDSRTKIFPDVNNDPEWHRKYYYGADASRLNSQQIPTRNSQSASRFAQEMVSPKTIPHEIQAISAPYSSVQKEKVPETSLIPINPPTSGAAIRPAQSSSMISSKPTTYSQQKPRAIPIRDVSPSPPLRPQVTAADIRRRPSLYKIPAWPHSRDNNQTTSSVAFSDQNRARNTESNDPRPLHSNTPHRAKATSSNTPNATASSLQNPVPQTPKQQAPVSKHSPNLIIDIAQTSQETFPFAAVAARHNKPIQKVFDTFSAIIQLPLLKQAADGRRHGPLGSERMRQYREAKRAMERANREREREREKGKGVRRGGWG